MAIHQMLPGLKHTDINGFEALDVVVEVSHGCDF